MKPDFTAQFRTPGHDNPRVYMGGTAVSCGEHPSLPKRHRWGPWQKISVNGTPCWDRCCRNCALADDLRFDKPRNWRPS